MSTECAEQDTLDIIKDNQKVGTTFDGAPGYINTDEQCVQCLEKLKSTLKLTDQHRQLIDQCLAVVSPETELGTEVNFNIGDILELVELSSIHLEASDDILACVTHLNRCIEFSGELPKDIYLQMANLHGCLGDMMTNAMSRQK